MRLEGKVAVITGAGSGIGRATSILFAREGAQVVCVDKDQAGVAETAELIGRNGQTALSIQADVSRPEQVQRMAEKCRESADHVDILFNNAGYSLWQAFEATTEETWSLMVGANLASVFLCSKYLLPLMKAARSGSIINHASIDGILGNPKIAAYSAAKGGIIPLTHVMAFDLAKYNIRVNCLCSGGIRTSATVRWQQPVENMLAATPLRRLGTPEEVANAVLFLASDEASYVSGANLVIDGARTVITPGTF